VANCSGLLLIAEIDIEKCVQDSIKIFCSTPKSATFRQHAQFQKNVTPRKDVHTYYTQDYHETPKTELVSFFNTEILACGRWYKGCGIPFIRSHLVNEEKILSGG